MYFTIYKTTNLINGNVYIGQHKTKRLEDNYLGSGKVLLEAIKKYGRSNFKKEILFIFDNPAEMNAKEKELVNKEFFERHDTYNLQSGGNEGNTISDKQKEQISTKLKEYYSDINIRRKLGKSIKDGWTFEARKKKSEWAKQRVINGQFISPNKGRNLTIDERKLISERTRKAMSRPEVKEKLKLR